MADFNTDTILRGKNGHVYMSDSAGTPAEIVGIDQFSVRLSIPNEKFTLFGIGKITILGDLEWGGSFSGFWTTGTTGAQKWLDLYLAQEEIKIELYPDVLQGVKMNGTAKLTNATIDTDGNSTGVRVSGEFEGNLTPTVTYETTVP